MPLPHARPDARAAPRGLVLGAAALAAAAQLGCVHMRGTPEQPAILNLRIEGMKALDEGEVKARLATHESDRSLPIPIAGPLIHQTTGIADRIFNTHRLKVALVDPDQLAVDRQRIEAFYHERGFYDVQVSEAQVIPVGDRQADVVYRVVEGPPVRVASIETAGIDQAPEARSKLGRLPLAVGDRFTVEAYDAARTHLLEALKNTGWATAQVGQEAQVLPEEHRALVKYTLDAGERFRFGPIFVAGAGSIPRDRIRERAALELHPGDWFDESKLAKSQARVFDMGVFGGVRVNRGTPDVQRGIIPVVVAVREAPFRTVRAGPSVGSTAGLVSGARIDFSGTVGWTHRNFLGDLRKLDLNLRAGYAKLASKSGPVGLLSAEFSQPGAVTRNIDATVRMELERGIQDAYDFWSERGSVSFPIHVERRWTLVPSFSMEVYQLSNVAESFNPSNPSEPATIQSCPQKGGTARTCLLSYFEQRVGWDGRDDPVNTHRGIFLSLSVQEGLDVAGLGYQYFRFLPDVRGYVPLGRIVIAARAQLGALVPVNSKGAQPPIVARFYAGGPNSMRGYGYNRLSPMVCERVLNTSTGQLECTGTWVPVGGNGLAVYTLEARFPVHGNLHGAVFSDLGNVTKASGAPRAWRDVLALDQLQPAFGVGLRYRTPIGPVRADIAARIPNHHVPSNFPDEPLAHREPVVAFQLIVGEAF